MGIDEAANSAACSSSTANAQGHEFLRDQFACMAMQALVSISHVTTPDGSIRAVLREKAGDDCSLIDNARLNGWGNKGDDPAALIAWEAYAIADAMMAERGVDQSVPRP